MVYIVVSTKKVTERHETWHLCFDNGIEHTPTWAHGECAKIYI